MSYTSKIRRDRFPKAEKGARITTGDPSEEELKKLVQAIGEHESDGRYHIRGKVVQKGMYKGQRALGKYQVMPGNLAEWSKFALGRTVTEKEFLDSPELQDKIVTARMRVILKSYPDPRDAASVWFSGRPFADNKGFDGFQSVADYVNDVTAIMNKNGGWGGVPLKKIASNGNTTMTASGGPFPKKFTNMKGKDGKQLKAPEGVDPAVFYKDPDVIAALKKTGSKAGADGKWGEDHQAAWESLPKAKQEAIKSGKTNSTTAPSTNAPATATPAGTTVTPAAPASGFIDINADGTPVDAGTTSGGGKDTPYGKARKDPTPFNDKINIGSSDRARGFLSPLAIEQIAPELLTIATNKREPVTQMSYDPQLKQTFDISHQLGRNENQSTFNSLAKIAEMTGNVDMLTQLAAQKYQADQQYNMQEVQGNAQQKLQTYNQNIDLMNDSRVRNLALIADQQAKQAQADFNTRREDIGALSSLASKKLQNDLENKTYNAYANLFKHYGFDKKGNVVFQPDTNDGGVLFDEGQRMQFGLLAAKNGIESVDKIISKDKNADGSTTTKINNSDLQDLTEARKAMKEGASYQDVIATMPHLARYSSLRD